MGDVSEKIRKELHERYEGPVSEIEKVAASEARKVLQFSMQNPDLDSLTDQEILDLYVEWTEAESYINLSRTWNISRENLGRVSREEDSDCSDNLP